ncbi:MAG: hypothetical protein HOA17_09600 [Candidatus Melainabacteria bacterium]|jgi:hypothetical protein|nr:hypothetical protein [Candidatus Melainabacteria bacterium]
MDPSQGAKLAEAFIANQERNGATANLHDPELRRSAANLLEAIDLVQEQLPSQDSSTNLNNLQKFVDTVTFGIKTTVKDLFHMVA